MRFGDPLLPLSRKVQHETHVSGCAWVVGWCAGTGGGHSKTEGEKRNDPNSFWQPHRFLACSPSATAAWHLRLRRETSGRGGQASNDGLSLWQRGGGEVPPKANQIQTV